jgi:hypothetical protein
LSTDYFAKEKAMHAAVNGIKMRLLPSLISI